MNKKKVCRFCGTNEYNEKYANHLNKKHKDIMNKRTFIKNISNRLTAEQLEQVEQFVRSLKKN